MNLKEVFDQLASSEVSQLNLVDEATGEIAERHYAKVVANINLGLTALYKRFNLKEGRVSVQLIPGQLSYALNSQFALSNQASSVPVKYLVDDGGVMFQDDLLKVSQVFTDDGTELVLNDRDNWYSITTPSTSVIRVPPDIVDQAIDLPECYKTERLLLVYRANHPRLVVDGPGFDPEQVPVELPYSHLEALLLFVASRAHTPVGMTNEFHAGNSYYAKYEQACQDLETQNLGIDQGSQTTRLQRNGWV